MSGLAKSFIGLLATTIAGIILTKVAMEEWLVQTFEANPLQAALGFLVSAAFGAAVAVVVNEWRLRRSPMGRRVDEMRGLLEEERRARIAAESGRTTGETDEEVARLRDDLSSTRQALSFYQKTYTQWVVRGKGREGQVRSKFSTLTPAEAEFVYGLFTGSAAHVTAENAVLVASTYRRGAIENLNSSERRPEPGCFVTVSREWAKMLNEHPEIFREVHGIGEAAKLDGVQGEGASA